MTPSNHQLTRDLLKTETRRLSGLEMVNQEPAKWVGTYVPDRGAACFRTISSAKPNILFIKPRYHARETVFVKEGIYLDSIAFDTVRYSLDYKQVMFFQSANPHVWQWKRPTLSPMFLPHSAARTFIKMLNIFPQRAQGITLAQANAEGFDSVEAWGAEIDRLNPKKKPYANSLWLWCYQFLKVEDGK